ncbi:hypothetical protein C8K30_10311 [Promicromonospora sp. AC04]|uniref:hypothetical protein n=1 Tax=Promicromonospora sp. AC04 TaxID=2135723 RepID=UPI000D38D1E9|nr:hypothetical protein [Promicromonospora sp. AC04]PUB28595.1 hypothetical protein C8K30_10311 [Promicromonospora sp. AC04]
MATDETTRQVNKRAIDALEEAQHRLGEAVGEVQRGIEPLENLSRVTNAHDAALENLRALSARVREVREDVARRWIAESEGE